MDENYWLPVATDALDLDRGIIRRHDTLGLVRWMVAQSSVIKWGEKHGMTFEITPPYTAEPNGTVERFGGHINDIQRTMIIDAKMTEEMWPYATDTAIYIYNRLINPKTKISR
ncbi:hypothetical protein PDIDSM_3216 [Penicillium digitatum]|nr:hypothetical protein PDIDSM_3216 [Penicillium digitatum]